MQFIILVNLLMNIKFLKACEIILNSSYTNGIRAMCDVTNGGLRGDLYEINYEAKCGVNIFEEKVRNLVNPNVLNMLERVGVDYLGVSLDALLIYCSESTTDDIITDLRRENINCDEIGYVDDSNQVCMTYKGKKTKDILPKFRESAYTKIKQEIGEEIPESIENMEKSIQKAALQALEKRKKIIGFIKKEE
ncbi:MAG: AIR synthase-related protein [Promethearchaeota archaeon]